MTNDKNKVRFEPVFKCEIWLNEKYYARFRKVFDSYGGSNTSTSDVLDFCIRKGIDELLSSAQKGDN